MSTALTNWSRTQNINESELIEPDSIEELTDIVSRSRKLRVMGTRHSFSKCIDAEGATAISTRRLSRIMGMEEVEGKLHVRVQSGATYAEVGEYLSRRKCALPNLASLTTITVGGAVATPTHGSGIGNQCLATSVREIVRVNANGEIERVSRKSHTQDFDGSVIAFGMLGVVGELLLEVEDYYDIRQYVFRELDWEWVIEHWDEMLRLGYSVSMFTNFENRRIQQVWVKQREDQLHSLALLDRWERSQTLVHPCASGDSSTCTTPLTRGPWHRRLCHFKPERMPVQGNEIQAEYFLPLDVAIQAIHRVFDLAAEIAPLLDVAEIRCIASDSLWLGFEMPSIGIHFTFKNRMSDVLTVVQKVEERLVPMGAKPHLAKLSRVSGDQVASTITQIDKFRALRRRQDPAGKFLNNYLAKIFCSVNIRK